VKCSDVSFFNDSEEFAFVAIFAILFGTCSTCNQLGIHCVVILDAHLYCFILLIDVM